MNQYWDRSWEEMRDYARYIPLAPLVALLPFLLNLSYWRAHEGAWVGLYSSLIYGTVIGCVILLCFGSVYAVLTWILIRTGKFYRPPVFVQILLGSFGAMTGMWLVS